MGGACTCTSTARCSTRPGLAVLAVPLVVAVFAAPHTPVGEWARIAPIAGGITHALHDHADRYVLHHCEVPVVVVPIESPSERDPRISSARCP